ncbi:MULTISPECIES: helix-turn-helix transcriptional regulator [Gordonia]|uniref:Helix-turn-helix transcriptional regulator n=2 Tax=Gordonia terrae TaxID=2055 RepID=A0AAD0NYS2_9ACTN|nr:MULTISPECIES: helix-turn-helix transcriptional regulator [Gordonia]VTR11058.1 Spore germination protein gerE [Clostridioides difficile]ANY24490.1 helix-turn-helix transcriptional regulator [Gordonia terrae]AWO85238.1 helix-turn-helix transcriptional regulator [Gordonia terrae]UPW07916.1 helix-turn-helix transcriptional regulator [Gordonia terrae]VTS59179.1 Spore germination protein gerE [Gordonia terrae]
MTSSLTAERVRRDIEVVAHAGLTLDEFFAETVASLGRAVPADAFCIGTFDPNTVLLTSARKYGALLGQDHRDPDWGLLEYGQVEPTAFRQMVAERRDAVGMKMLERDAPEHSNRMSQLMIPEYCFHDEARLVLRDGDRAWAGISLFRSGSGCRPFDSDEVEFLASLSRTLAHGVRVGLLSSVVADMPSVPGPVPAAVHGPAVLIIDRSNEIVQMSAGSQERIADLASGPNGAAVMNPIYGLIGAARRYGSGESSVPPRLRVRGASGMWLVIHASPLSSADGRVGEVVVTIEEARPPEIIPLVVEAFGLTARERDVTQMVLQSVATKDIATALHVSAYTVQDHLKSIFDKAGVRSRRELIARIYFDQYAQRLNEPLLPSGSFAAADNEL